MNLYCIKCSKFTNNNNNNIIKKVSIINHCSCCIDLVLKRVKRFIEKN